MSELTVEPIPCLSDNYAWLMHGDSDGFCGVVDPSEAEPVRARLKARGLRLTHIFNTHHHPDHVGGNRALKEEFGAVIVGPGKDAARIPDLDVGVQEGEVYRAGGH